jgi:hypothetical protein
MIATLELGDTLEHFDESPWLINAVLEAARACGVTGVRVQRHGHDIALLGDAVPKLDKMGHL